jgi:hypothetical protein
MRTESVAKSGILYEASRPSSDACRD